MPAALPAEAVDLLRAADRKTLSWRVGSGYLLNHVEVDAPTQHRVNDLVNDGWLYLPGMAGPGDLVPVYPTERGLDLLATHS